MTDRRVNDSDSRVLGITSHMSNENLSEETHGTVRAWLEQDVRDFLKQPTIDRLRSVVQYALVYQDSFLLGPKRKGYQAPRRAPVRSQRDDG